MTGLSSTFGFFGPWRGGLRLFLMLLWILVCLPFQVIARVLHLPLRDHLPVFFHTVLTEIILGLHLTKAGSISRAHPTLFIANHMSYLDIPALGRFLPTRFISKAEVAEWPLFGLLAKLQDTVFIERRGRLAREHSSAITLVLEDKKNIVLFPEGTSTDGTHLKPFKSSLLQTVLEAKVPVTLQAVSIACVDEDGLAALYPWYGDMTLVDHLWKVLQAKRFRLHITFHPPLDAKSFTDRKLMAEALQAQVTSGPHGIVARLS
jgi:1-acyl-sn-glycerol-3-phosphate acyltransferase